MPRFEDLTGQKFGRLTVLEPTEQKTKDGRRIWKCQCDCGNIKYTSCQNLKRGHCTSCGCKNKEQITALGHSRGIDITGKRYGKLVVLKRAEEKLPYSDSVAWICKCDCGNEIITTVSHLNSGNTTSCGCTHKSEGEELISQILTKESINFIKEYQTQELKSQKGNLLRFDFYLPDYDIFIEFDGDQHYRINRYFSLENCERDFLKNEFCLLNNFNLYRIPYSEKQNLKLYNFQDLVSDRFLVKEVDHYHIKNLLCN